ncbi:Emopamil-binding protein [Spinellus fusiger]|nr:Emopamil-binding protein [Spinellus fusiger]
MADHPYYPKSLLLESYVPNSLSIVQLLAGMALVMTVFLLSTYQFASTKVKSLAAIRFTWFLLSGCLHCGFELYFILHHATLVSRNDILAQLWKEYAHSDSRYLHSDPLVLALETITVCVIGPLCFLAAMSIQAERPSQYVWQLIASVLHMMSCSLYFVMDWPTGFANCDPHPLYFWVYFVGMNSPWLVVPGLLIKNSLGKILPTLNKAKLA